MRILFVAMPNSVHSARWIAQTAGLGWDVHLFPSTPAGALLDFGGPHPELRDVTVYGASFRRHAQVHPSVRVRGLTPLKRLSGVLSTLLQPRAPAFLASLIRRLKPDVVHSLELQHAGYLTLEAKKRLGAFPPWVVSNWGSDISVFGRLDGHAGRIRELLAACDYYTCECKRDVELARTFDFRGEELPIWPIAGGMNVGRVQGFRQAGPPSERRVVALKGYTGWAGRGLVGVRAVELASDVLQGYRVVTYLAAEDVRLAAGLVTASTGLEFEHLPRSSHEEMLRLHGRARTSIGLSIGDGISTSALEAMAAGSFPIQSHTSCLEEWVRDGETGLLVHPDDPQEVAAALRRAVTDDELVDRAAARNLETVQERLDSSRIRPAVLEMYERIAAGPRS
ncbi:MAG: glycosyltransferase family 4 protein [Gaiellaceae bacterium]